MIGETWSHDRITAKLGEGGMREARLAAALDLETGRREPLLKG